jgi:MoaA/NifB/PqqE/SkfB family radical SAM enzyme
MEPEKENVEASASIALPKWIAWEITARCNLRCIHCRSASDDKGDAGEYSTQEAKGLIDEIAGYASPVLVLSGGEPLLREDCFTLARHGTAKGLRMCLATNGTLVGEAVCEEILESGIRKA